MEQHQDINNRLDELLAQARTTKPVMGVDEVRNLIATAPAASASNSGASKSSSTLYMFLGGIAVIAIAAGIWFFSDLNSQQGAVSQTAEPQANVESNNATNVNTETAQQTSQSNATDDATTNESGTVNNNQADDAIVAAKTNEEHTVKEQPAASEKEKPVALAEPSKNKTYIVTGGDFIARFETEDKKVEMKLKDDAVKELSINGKNISNADYFKYKDIIEQGKKMMIAEKAKNASSATSAKTPEEQKRDDTNTRLFNAFTEQLIKDKLIDEDKYSFKLTSSELLIDGKAQPDAVRQKYLDLFKTNAGRDLGGSVFKFNHGMD